MTTQAKHSLVLHMLHPIHPASCIVSLRPCLVVSLFLFLRSGPGAVRHRLHPCPPAQPLGTSTSTPAASAPQLHRPAKPRRCDRSPHSDGHSILLRPAPMRLLHKPTRAPIQGARLAAPLSAFWCLLLDIVLPALSLPSRSCRP